MLALTNVTAREQRVRFSEAELGRGATSWRDLVGGQSLRIQGGHLEATLRPYGILWLSASGCDADAHAPPAASAVAKNGPAVRSEATITGVGC